MAVLEIDALVAHLRQGRGGVWRHHLGAQAIGDEDDDVVRPMGGGQPQGGHQQDGHRRGGEKAQADTAGRHGTSEMTANAWAATMAWNCNNRS